MSKKAYSQEERIRIRQALLDTGLDLFLHQGLYKTTLPQIYKSVGISKTFFYTFFPGKEELITEILCLQQPRLLQRAQYIMSENAGNGEQAMRQFLHECFYKGNNVAILSLEEQQVYSCITEKTFLMFREKQKSFFHELLSTFGFSASPHEVLVTINLFLSAVLIRKAVLKEAPFLFPEAADEMSSLHVQTLLDYVEGLKRNT